jgi:hypothetical protein
MLDIFKLNYNKKNKKKIINSQEKHEKHYPSGTRE